MSNFAKAYLAACVICWTISIVGCGSHNKHTVSSVRCGVPAYAGCSVPKTSGVAPSVIRGHTFPDISEYQGCPAFHGPVVFKVYEGNYGMDHSARCNANRVHKLKDWAAVYSFLRPNNCSGQGYATVHILKEIGGVPGPVIADAEVPLPQGCVSAFLNTVRRLRGNPVDIYTSPGTWPGGQLDAPVWVATYGSRPGCIGGDCKHVGWQYTDRGNCGAGTTDCSIDNGLLSQTVAKPTPKPKPVAARIAELRKFARHRGCYSKGVVHKRACAIWGSEVRRLERQARQHHTTDPSSLQHTPTP